MSSRATALSSGAPIEAPWYSLPDNLVLMAGAGAGKTHGLISLALHVLSGARPDGEPLAPARLCAVTFTEKAAAEMKERLRARVRALADGGTEKELSESFATFGITPPPPSFWDELYGTLGSAFVGTFHSWCAQILRRYPAEAELEPGFTMLEEGEANELFVRCAEETVLRSLEAGGEEGAEARRLIRALGFRGQGDHGAALLELLNKVHLRLSEDGVPASALPQPSPELSFATARDGLCAVLEQIVALPLGRPAADGVILEARALLPRLVEAGPEDAAALLREVKGLMAGINLARCGKEAKPAFKLLREEAGKAFLLACGDAIAAPLHRDFVRCLERAEAAYREEKQRRSALDFADLVRRTRDLLRDHAAIRLEVQSRIGVLLVDECQDTNRLQLDLVALLCERRDGAPRPVSGSAFDSLPLEPAMLACVGDRKQSIYEFRGADVSVFVDIARRFREGDGKVEFLQHNRRSRPALLRFFNRLFAQVMAPDEPHPWRVEYRPEEDDLSAWRPDGPPGVCVQLLTVEGETSDERRAAEARAVAAQIQRLLAPDGPEVVGVDREGRTLRRAEGKDIVVLLRRFSHIKLFRQELLARSIPHVVVKGGGFFQSQEVIDLRSLLALLADPDDRLALAAVLRSPLVALTDSTVALLALEHRLSLERLRRLGLPPGATEDERERLEAFLEAVDGVAPLMHRVGVAGVLEHVVEALDLEAVLAAGFEGEQRVANVRKLIDWARSERPAGPGAAARQLTVKAEQEGREGQAVLVEESDPGAVRLMTIHQSKGLEFPVVFVPECGAGANQDNDLVLFDRDEGLCVRPRGEDGETVATSAAAKVQAALRSRQQAELERLFYVAATRARDLLIFSGENGRRGGGPSWRSQLDRFIAEDPEAAQLIETVAAEADAARLELTEPEVPRPTALDPAVEALVERSAEPPTITVRSLLAPVTQLADYALCPRRHHLAHVVGVEELPRREPVEDRSERPLGELSASERGSLVHLALERLDFSREPLPQIRSLLQAEGTDPDSPAGKEIAADVVAFAESALGRSFGELPPARFHRELPFVLAIRDGGFTLHLRGTVDVLAVMGDGTALILDYKHTRGRGRGADAYAFQLACYALAARTFLPPEVELKTGIAFLKDHGAPPDVRTLGEEALAAFRSSLLRMARELIERRRKGDYPVLARKRCEALRCGFVYQCHASRSTRAQLVIPGLEV